MSEEIIHPDVPGPDTYLTETEVREILGLSRQSCYNMRKAGIFTSHYIKGKVKYSAQEVEAFIIRKSLPEIRVTPTIRTRAKPGEPKKAPQARLRKKPSEGRNTPPPPQMPPASYEDFDNYFI
jgi:predicted DNA-binding transcriptional regulator AlpA